MACSSGDGSGSFLSVSGAGLFFSILFSLTSSDARVTSSDVVDSASRDGALPLEPVRSLPFIESRLGRSVGTGGASEFEPIVCIEPLEKRDIFEAMEKRE